METKSLVRTVAAASLVFAGMPSAPLANAQAAGGSGVRAVCCKCVDGSQQRVSLNTRTAPWRVATGSSAPVAVNTNVSNAGWSPLAPAGWVGPATSAVTTYTYTLTITVPRCAVGGRVSIKGQFGADNSAVLFLDNTQISQTTGGIEGFKAPNFGSFSNPVMSGTHTLRVVVTNASGPTAMILSGALITECPNSTELSANGREVPGTKPEAVACACDEAKKEA